MLTDAGETFLTRARSILADVAALRQDKRKTSGELDETVKLGVPPSVGLVLLAPLLQQIRADHPKIRLRMLVDEAALHAQIRLTIAMELETLPTIRDLVAGGTIRSILPLTAVQTELASGKLIA